MELVAPARPRLDEVTAMTAWPPPPMPLTPLIGRAQELHDLTEVVERERVVTLTGSGGCGKTRLASELSRRLTPSFPGGIAWIDLASLGDGERVAAVVAGEIGVVERRGEPLTDRIAGFLTRRLRCLVVLDNVEHLVAPVATMVAALTAAAPDAHIVCTSREPLGVAGEVVWRVPSLGVPPDDTAGAGAGEPLALAGYDAVALFIERAARVRRGFRLTAANSSAIARICVRLDGLPLAIELAAARVRTMPPERIAEQIDDRFRLLAGGPRTVTARQQTLHASVAWSEDLLNEEERTVFRRLGVFSGGFTLEAAERIVSAVGNVDPYNVAEIVTRLVDKSLVQLDEDRDRYWLLDTIRAFALQRLLDTGETEATRDAHASWCVDWTTRLEETDNADDMNRWWAQRIANVAIVDPEWPNCATALAWLEPGSPQSLRLVAGLGSYWALRQRAEDSFRYGMTSVLRGDPIQPEWLQAVVALHAVRTNAGDEQYARLRDQAIDQAAAVADDRSRMRLEGARHLALVMAVGPRPDVLKAIDDLAADAIRLEEWSTAWNATQSPAVVLAIAGRTREAERRVAHLTGARATLIRAVAAQARGEIDTAARYTEEAKLTAERRLGSAMDRVLVTVCTAEAALHRCDPTILDALQLWDITRESLPQPFAAAFGLADGVNEVLGGRAVAARQIFASVPPFFVTGLGLVLRAQVELALDDVESARNTAVELRHRCADASAPRFESVADLVLAECDRSSDPVGALDLAHRALANAATFELWLIAIDALELVAVLLAGQGRTRQAAPLLAAAGAARERLGYAHRFAHRAVAVETAAAALASVESWNDGLGLDLPEAIALAQRMRGERHRATTGWESLSPTEERVVELVASGLTNPEIASRLVMSRATVKTHLVHVYAKLGIGTRSELVAQFVRRSS